MSRRLFALVPLKDLAAAKTRLAAVLAPAEREQLVLAMARDVLVALRGAPAVERVVLVSDMPALPARLGIDGIDGFAAGGGGLNADLALAAAWAQAQGASHVLIAHADLPCLTAQTVEAFVGDAADELRAAACKLGSGTNLLHAPLPLPLPLVFGRDSLARFRAAARQAGRPLAVRHDPALAADVDEFDDLALLGEDFATAWPAGSWTTDWLWRRKPCCTAATDARADANHTENQAGALCATSAPPALALSS